MSSRGRLSRKNTAYAIYRSVNCSARVQPLRANLRMTAHGTKATYCQVRYWIAFGADAGTR